MVRLTDCAQGYCETYCKKYGYCFGDPGDCIFQREVTLYERLKSYEGTGLEPEEIVKMQAMAEGIFQKFGRLYELAQEEDAKGGAHELRLSE